MNSLASLLGLLALLSAVLGHKDKDKHKSKKDESKDESTDASKDTSTASTLGPIETTASVQHYQFCFELKDLNLYNLDYHSRDSAYGRPTGQVHVFDAPSASSAYSSSSSSSIRSMNVNLDMSSNKNVSSYHYKLDAKLCWLDLASTQLYFDFEIFQFYHPAMQVGKSINTGLTGSGVQKAFKAKAAMNLTSNSQEYSGVTVNVKYECELKLVTRKEYDSFMKGQTGINGSMSEFYANSVRSARVMDKVGMANDEDVETDVMSRSSGGSSSSDGMVFSAVIAAILGFFALVGVMIYLYKMYSRKDYDTIDENDDGGSKSKLKRISLRDTAKKMKSKIMRESGNDEEYADISLKSKESVSYSSNDDRRRSKTETETEPGDESIDVSIVTNESHGLP